MAENGGDLLMIPKHKPIRSQKLRDSAKGQECTIQCPSVCSHDPDTTVLAHLTNESHGMGLKADDVSACFACSSCHDWIDRRTMSPYFPDGSDREWYMRRAMVRTWRRWIEMGLVKIV